MHVYSGESGNIVHWGVDGVSMSLYEANQAVPVELSTIGRGAGLGGTLCNVFMSIGIPSCCRHDATPF